jgi:Zinc knuckle./Retroviral aspartyl protease.
MYEIMQANLKMKAKRNDDKGRRGARDTLTPNKNCFNCQEKGHISGNCPKKSKGIRCYKCGVHGHITVNCPGRTESTEKESCDATYSGSGKYYKEVQVANNTIIALIDTGSDLSLIRAENYIRIGAPRLGNTKLRFRGIGSNCNDTIGDFSTDIIVDGIAYPITVHVVPDTMMQHALLIGTDFLNKVEINIKQGKIKCQNCQ